MNRPWVKPSDVIEYTDSAKVKTRENTKLEYDIARAEKYVIFHTHNKFDSERYEIELPSDVKMAVILLAEAYAIKGINAIEGIKKSESFDDYSYTLDTESDVINKLGLGPLLEDYVITPNSGKAVVKLRSL